MRIACDLGRRMGLFCPEVTLTPTKVHAMPLLLTSARLRSSPTLPMSTFCLRQGATSWHAVCLPAAVPLCLEWHHLQYEDHPLRQAQLAVSWCTSRVHFDAGLNHSPACLPPASSHWPQCSDHAGFERLFCPRLQRYTDLELDELAGAPLDGDW